MLLKEFFFKVKTKTWSGHKKVWRMAGFGLH